MFLQNRHIKKIIHLGLIILLTSFSSVAWSNATCTKGSGLTSIIGLEFFATRTYADGAHDYDVNFLQCSGGQVISYNSTTLSAVTLDQAFQQTGNTLNMSRVFRNKCDSLAIVVHDNFQGTIFDGVVTVNLARSSFPISGSRTYYYDKFVNGIAPGESAPIACPLEKAKGGACFTEQTPFYESNPVSVSVSNPVNAGTGDKHHFEAIFPQEATGGLEYSLSYTSRAIGESYVPKGRHGKYWISGYDRNLSFTGNNNAADPGIILLLRADGQSLTFTYTAGKYQSDADVTERLTRQANASGVTTGWTVETDADEIEKYDATGKLISLTQRNGLTQVLNYDANGRLLSVTDPFGRQLQFAYDASNRVTSLTDPAGNVTQFSYDAKDNLNAITYPDGKIKTYLYENSAFPNSITGITDENGNRFATYTYDAQGHAISTEHAGGVDRASLSYGTNSTTVTDALGTQRDYNFQKILGIPRSTGNSQSGGAGCNAASSATNYDANGNVSDSIDFNGNKTIYSYDLTRNLETSRTEGLTASGANTSATRTISTEWHTTFTLPVKITEPGRETTWEYDSYGNVTRHAITDTATGKNRVWTTASTYSSTVPGALLQKVVDGPRTDVNDLTTTDYYAPDAVCAGNHKGCRGQVKQITNALEQSTQFSQYNADGQPEIITDANGLLTQLQYDSRQRLISSQIGNETTRFSYDNVGQITEVTQPDGSSIFYTYDAAHRLTQITDSLGNHISYTLDLMGNRIQEDIYDPNNQLSQRHQRQYDALNRLFKDIGAQNQVSQFGYDAQGNLATATDPLNHSSSFGYDALNRLQKSVDPANGQIDTALDALDNLTSLTDPKNNSTQYQRDGLNNLLSEILPDQGTIQYGYDSAGNRISKVDARGQKTTYGYDALNRLTLIQAANDPVIQFAYDQGTNAIGLLSKMTDAAGATLWSYDLRGRVTQKIFKTGRVALTTQYHYNNAGQLDAITYPSGQSVQPIYVNGLLTALQNNNQTLVGNIRYQPFGAPASWTYGNQISSQRNFDLDGRITAYGLGGRSRQLNYDAAGHIVAYTDTDPTYDQSFAYDELSRLITETQSTAQTSYDYDANGNRTQAVQGAQTLNYGIDDLSNRLLNQSNNAGITQAYQYDNAGNLTNDGRNTYSYDGRGRLAKAVGSFGTESYRINGLGLRVAKFQGNLPDLSGDANQDGVLTVADLRLIALMNLGSVPANLSADCNHDGKITASDATCTQAKIADMRINPAKYAQVGIYFVYDEAGHLIGEYDQNGAPIRETVWLGDMPVAVLAGNSTYYVYADHLNTPRAIADSSGKTVWRWDADAFGATTANEDPDKDGSQFVYNLRFPGQYYDKSTGLHYNGFRDYAPAIGRYIQSDPIGLAGGLNTYAYVDSDPLSNNDINGLEKTIGHIPSARALFPMFFPKDFWVFFIRDYALLENAINDQDIPGVCTVYAHGVHDETNFYYGILIEDKILYPKELNKLLNQRGCVDKPVMLKACGLGSGKNSFAKQLSKLPGRTEVYAVKESYWANSRSPRNIPYPKADGLIPNPDLSKPGSWVRESSK